MVEATAAILTGLALLFACWRLLVWLFSPGFADLFAPTFPQPRVDDDEEEVPDYGPAR
ncbi:MAG TPA: hypothetical protein VGB52_07665 [Actinomycetota bacterium]